MSWVELRDLPPVDVVNLRGVRVTLKRLLEVYCLEALVSRWLVSVEN